MTNFTGSSWLRLLLLALAVFVLIASFIGYFSQGMLIDFANLNWC